MASRLFSFGISIFFLFISPAVCIAESSVLLNFYGNVLEESAFKKKGVEGVKVSIVTKYNLDDDTYSTITDENGYYELNNVEVEESDTGDIGLVASKKNYYASYKKVGSYWVDDGDTINADITIESIKKVKDITGTWFGSFESQLGGDVIYATIEIQSNGKKFLGKWESSSLSGDTDIQGKIKGKIVNGKLKVNLTSKTPNCKGKFKGVGIIGTCPTIVCWGDGSLILSCDGSDCEDSYSIFGEFNKDF